MTDASSSAPLRSAPPRHVFLVDASGFIFRAFHALPPMTRGDGTPINAVYGFTTMLMKLIDDTDADHVAVIFDAARKTFRNDIYPEYKANRVEPPAELVPQFPLVREAVRAFNVACIESPGWEADDLIATYARLAREQGAEVTIVSSDKDLMQLIDDGRVYMLDTIKNKRIGPEEVFEKFGVYPDKVIDVQALAGDSVDNVPGVPGIGVKTAAQLIAEYGSLESLLDRASEIKQPKRREALIEHAEKARVSKELVRLRDDVPPPEPLSAFVVRRPDPKLLRDFLLHQGFKSLLARVESRAQAAEVGAPAPAAAVLEAAEPDPGESVEPPTGELVDVARDYDLVQTLDALEAWVEAATEQGWVAVDTETTGLDAATCALVGVSLSLRPGKACYIPIRHRVPEAQGELALDLAPIASAAGPLKQIPWERAKPPLKRLLEDPAVLKVGHNLKFDIEVLMGEGIRVAPFDDTMLMSYVLGTGAHGHGLDELAMRHFGHETIKFKDVAGTGKTQVTFDLVDLDRARDYAAEDADITGRLHRLLKPRLLAERMLTVYETLERPLVPVLAEMERAGVCVDADELKRLSEEFARRLGEIEIEINRIAPRPFNVASPKQLGDILFEDLGLAGGRKGKTGAYGTGADILEALAAEGHSLPARVLDWRQLAKLKSTYTDALIQQINPATGRVHTSFSMAATATGRLASTDPNLQNIPIRTEEGRKIRRAFIAPPGHVLLSADYSQIELRLLAAVADIAALKEAFRKGIDIHALTASQVFGVPVEGMDPMIRRRAKAINFGIVYGISPFGLAAQIGVSQAEAKAYIGAYFNRYPGILDFMERTKAYCREHGYVVTPFGRRCFIPDIKAQLAARRSFAERAAINAPLQGGAADIIKRAMIRMPEALESAGLKARMLLQVHDELVFEVPEAEIEKTAEVVRETMEAAVAFEVPMVAETGWGHTWADAH